MEQHIEEMRRLIREEISRCQPELRPNGCTLSQTEAGRKRIEDQILYYAITEGLAAGPAIALLEQDLSHGRAD